VGYQESGEGGSSDWRESIYEGEGVVAAT
jgi:hypothetical protein